MGKLIEATVYLDEARSALEGSSTGLPVLFGTNDVEAQQALAYHEEGGNQLTRAQEVLRRCIDQITQYRTRVATASTTSTPPLEPLARLASRSRPSPPRGRDAVEGEKPNRAEISAERRRSYILDGDGLGGGHVAGTGLPNKMEFPETWNDDEIINSIEDVAKNPDRQPELQMNGRWRVEGVRDGVDIRVVVHNWTGSHRTPCWRCGSHPER